MNVLQTAARTMRNGLEEMAALLVGERSDDLRADDTAAPGVGIPMPRRLPLRRPRLSARKGIAPWQKVGTSRR